MNEGLALVRSGQLLYTDDVGKDACGIGGIAAKDGKPTTEVVRKALTALKALEHRGGVCGDAGGVFFFLDQDDARIALAKSLIQDALAGGPAHWFGWRPVPANYDAIAA